MSFSLRQRILGKRKFGKVESQCSSKYRTPKRGKIQPTPTTPTKITIMDSSEDEDLSLNHKSLRENPENSIIEMESPNKVSATPSSFRGSQSQHVSELSESPISDGSTLNRREDISEWVKGDQTNKKSEPFSNFISEFDSPTKNYQNSEFMDTSTGFSKRKPREKKTLALQIKRKMLTYNAAVRMFPHEYKLGKKEDSLSLNLIILMCKYENKTTWTLSYDSDAQANKWILFRPRVGSDIRPGVCIKVFHPWQQVFLPSIDANVIFCTDFYHECSLQDVGVDEQTVKELIISSQQHEMELKSLNSCSGTSLLNLVPYSVQNPKTISKQIRLCKPSVNLEVVICQVWKLSNSTFALIKDSDNMFSALEIIHSENEELCDVLSVGAYLSFTNLGVQEKVTMWTSMPFFSVISLYGSKQNHYYKLGLRPDTKWNVEFLLHIPFTPKEPPTITLMEISNMKMYGEDKDCRLNIRARTALKPFKVNQVIIFDDSLLHNKVEVLSSFENLSSVSHLFDRREYVNLLHVRCFRGILTLDRFSSVEQ